jgi:MFS family permease
MQDSLHFMKANLRWLGVGFLLTFASAFGQTWFISLFAGEIQLTYGLSDGAWGSLYTVATLASAALMFWRGSLADTVPLSRLAPIMALIFATAAMAMATAQSIWMLGITLFLLRFCGQGMFTHMAMTAMGRWFDATRGRAVALANLGHPASEIVIPLLVVILIAGIGWRYTWGLVALLLVLGVGPLLWAALRHDRTPRGMSHADSMTGLNARHWNRADALRHWFLPALLPVLLTPGFIGTVVFFHQVHVSNVKGWSLATMAPGYAAFATATVASSFLAGWAADRFGAHRLLPVLLLPMGVGVALIGPAEQVGMWYMALGVIGITQGTASALWGVLFPAVYGTRHLGAIRSLATTIIVFSTAIGPGITGMLIDAGIDFPAQSLAMGAWCLALAVACFWIQQRLNRELAA